MEIARRQHVAIVEDDRGFGLSLAALFESDGVATDFFPIGRIILRQAGLGYLSLCRRRYDAPGHERHGALRTFIA